MIANQDVVKRFFFRHWLLSIASTISVLVIMLFLSNSFNLNTYLKSTNYNLKGNDAYKNHQYGDAGIQYQQALQISPSLYTIKYDLANAYYKQRRYAEAVQLYKQLFNETNKVLNAAAWNNLGNCFYIQGHLLESIQAYKNALILDDKDNIVRQNFLFVSGKIRQAIKTGNTTEPTKNEHSSDDSKDKEPNSSRNKRGEQSDDQLTGPYQVSDEQMNKLLKISKEQERVPSGLKSQIKKEKRKYTNEPDY